MDKANRNKPSECINKDCEIKTPDEFWCRRCKLFKNAIIKEIPKDEEQRID